MQIIDNQVLNTVGGGQCTGDGGSNGGNAECKVRLVDNKNYKVDAEAKGNFPGKERSGKIILTIPFG